MMAGNNITALPTEMAQCRNLQLLRVPTNKLPEVPAWLWELPNLAWYSDAANPVSYQPHLAILKTIGWQQLQLETKLGESAKNVVYRAKLKTNGQEVAVKLYGNGITTDGHPQDETYASILAGPAPNLIPIIGQIAGAPEGQRGLVMELIPPNFSVPGLPPDLIALTRDVIKGQLALPVVVTALRDVCAALKHLHQQGIMHGDVYAHNILMNPEGQAYMGDLGAASLYQTDTDNGKRERIDVRGFGYLVDDLLAHVAPTSTAKVEQLSNLRDGCLGYGAKAVTGFDTVLQALQGL
jgi:serine/threonine protein kinase